MPTDIKSILSINMPKGDQGVSGYSGYSGYSGISGYSGVSGISGYSGYSGISGYSGSNTMVYPDAGIPISTGSGWSGFKTTPTGEVVGTTDIQNLANKTLTSPVISGSITFGDSSTQSTAGASTGKAIAMAIVFGG